MNIELRKILESQVMSQFGTGSSLSALNGEVRFRKYVGFNDRSWSRTSRSAPPPSFQERRRAFVQQRRVKGDPAYRCCRPCALTR